MEGTHAATRRRVLGAGRQGTVSVPRVVLVRPPYSVLSAGSVYFSPFQVYLGYDLEICS